MKKLLQLLVWIACTANLAYADLGEQLKADEYWHNGYFAMALPIYETLYESNPSDAELNFKLGTCYLYTGKPAKALNNFYRAQAELTGNYHMYGTQNHAAPVETYFMLGETYRYLNLPDSASKYYLLYQANFDTKAPFNYTSALFKAKNVKEAKLTPADYTYKNLSILNSNADDVSPIINAMGNMLVFASNRGNEGLEPDQIDGTYPFDLYFSTMEGNAWTKPKQVGWNTLESEKPYYVSADGRSLYFGRNMNGKWKVYETSFDGRNWAEPKVWNKISGEITGLTISPDKSTAIVAIQKDKISHLYEISLIDDKWQNPTPIKNTESGKEEFYPFYHADNQIVYYSSNGYVKDGYGGYDLYAMAKDQNSEWQTLGSLNYPLNTTNDEKQMSLDLDQHVYLAKENGSNKKDIYLLSGFSKPAIKNNFSPNNAEVIDIIELERDIEVEVEVTEFEEKEVEKEVEKTEFEEKIVEEEVEVVEFEEKEVEVEVTEFEEINTGEPAKPDFSTLEMEGLTQEERETLFAKVDLYRKENTHKPLETASEETEKMYYLSEKGTSLNPADVGMNLLFGFNKYELSQDQKNRLDGLANILKKNPEVKIEIIGHADKIGSSSVNEKFAEMRALNVKRHLKAKGIDTNRLIAYGKSNFYSEDGKNIKELETSRRVEIVLLE